MSAILNFTLQEFPEGLSERRMAIAAEALDVVAAGWEVLDRIAIELEIVRTRMEVRVRGRVGVHLQQPCDRCLAAAEGQLDVPVDVLVRERPAREASNAEVPEGILYHDGEGFSLFDEVREAVLLALPQHPLCRPDCRGLCPKCGADLNQGSCDCPTAEMTDPRWAALKNLTASGSAGGPDRKQN